MLGLFNRRRGSDVTVQRSSGMLGLMNRAVHKMSLKAHVMRANLWRDSYNPLRGLSIARAVSELEEGERGAYGSLQWLYRSIEMQDATLGALIERRTSAVQEMGWDVKVPEGLEGADLDLAEKQAAALKEAYNGINNLKAVIEHLCLASFRGFSHVEILIHNGEVTLEPVEQWYWVREGINGDWHYNEKATFGSNKGESIHDRLFAVREVQRPINRVALIAFLRKNLSQKDWDGFIETYGIPAVFIIAPPDVPKDQEGEFQDVAERIASDARGALPSGSDIKTVDNGARGTNPFLEHIQYQDEQIVLRGTGGKLTMLAESGSGTLAGSAHADTFAQVARAEAEEISEIFREMLDSAILEEKFPGQKHHAYFEIAANEEIDTKEVVRDVVMLSKAGFTVAADQVSEKTGYDVTQSHQVGSEKLEVESGDDEAIANRREGGQRQGVVSTVDGHALMREAVRRDNHPIARLLDGALNASSDKERDELLHALNEILPGTPSENAGAALDVILQKAYTDSLSEVGSFQFPVSSEGIENGDYPGHPFRGNQYRTAKGQSREGKTKNQSRDQFGKRVKGEPLTAEENVERLTNSIAYALKKKKSIQGAAHREGLGRIDLPWGTPGDKRNDFKGGHGLSHVLGKHGEKDVKRLPEILSKGEITPSNKSAEKREIKHDGFVAVVVHDKDSRSWLLTGFTKDK